MKKQRSESGQVIIILVFAVIGLLGFTALAIDGGMTYSDRRFAQNASDAAALAGAYAAAHDPSTLTKPQSDINSIWGYALAVAKDNGFDNANAPAQTVDVYYPPVDGTYQNNPAYIQVKISSLVNTSLLHIIYGGQVVNRVESVAHFTFAKEGPLFGGNGLVSLAPHKCPGLWANGNFAINLDVGGIWVNSDGQDCGYGDVVTGDSNAKTVIAPSLFSVGQIADSFLTKGTVEIGTVQTGVEAYPYPPGITLVPPPDCAHAPAAIFDAATNTYSVPDSTKPASIAGGLPHNFGQGQQGKLEPGVYCIPASGFSFNAQSDFVGDGVTLVITGSDPCNWTWNGGSTFHVYGPGTQNASAQCSGLACTYKGIVIYVDPNDFTTWPAGTSTINGGNGSVFEGTIYAPTCSAQYKGNSSSVSFLGQIITYDFQLVGTASLKITFNDQDAGKAITPASTGLAK